jgi:hypothetical protein
MTLSKSWIGDYEGWVGETLKEADLVSSYTVLEFV